MNNSNPKKLSVSTLQLRRRLSALADPSLRRQPSPVPETKMESAPSPLWRHLVYFFPTLLTYIEIIGLFLVGWLGVVNLVSPELTFSASCQGQIGGKWQTRWGTITFTEQADGLIKGKFEYQNIDRGLVKGELTGRLSAQALEFTWREVQERQPPQTGSGTFLFGENCREFYGRTATLGSWQGKKL